MVVVTGQSKVDCVVETDCVVVLDTGIVDLAGGNEVVLEDTTVEVTGDRIFEVSAKPFTKERPAAATIPDLEASIAELRDVTELLESISTSQHPRIYTQEVTLIQVERCRTA